MALPKTIVEQLLAISREQLYQFWKANHQDIYGLGFFCDASGRRLYIVANTKSYHDGEFTRFKELVPSFDDEQFKWDIGNWKFPGGLFPSASGEQKAFDQSWQRIVDVIGDMTQGELEECCREVLIRLYQIPESPFDGIEGLIVMGPDDQGTQASSKHFLVPK